MLICSSAQHAQVFFLNLRQNILSWGCCELLIMTYICSKYLEERSTNAGIRAKSSFHSYARSKCGPWRWLRKVNLTCQWFSPTSNQNILIWGCCEFSLISCYCWKYLEERSANAGTRAKSPFYSYARSRCGPWRWLRKIKLTCLWFLPTSNQNIPIWGCCEFLLITFYCWKYREKSSDNAGTRARSPFHSYDRSKCGPWRKVKLTC